MPTEIGFEVKVSLGHEAAIGKVSQALKEEGFGVLTSIDVRNTLKEKIGVEFRPFTILGACNPEIAHRALSVDPHVGLLLPCNITVEEAGEGSLIRFVNPEALLAGFAGEGTAAMMDLAKDAGDRLGRVRQSLEQ